MERNRPQESIQDRQIAVQSREDNRAGNSKNVEDGNQKHSIDNIPPNPNAFAHNPFRLNVLNYNVLWGNAFYEEILNRLRWGLIPRQ